MIATTNDAKLIYPRNRILEIIETKTGLDKLQTQDMEIGIYNWAINFSEQNKIVKNWKNPKFVRVYIDKAKSVVANIDPTSYVGNQRLRARLNDGEFLPHDIANMQKDHLYPEVWRDVIDAHIRKTENAYEEKQVSMSDQFKCGKCHKKEVTYIEKQCRSADEPMSLLCTCIVCGNRWRIG